MITAPADDYAWWRNAIAGQRGPIHDGEPQCGYFKRRAFSRGPFVPGAIWRGEDGVLRAENNGSPQEPDAAWLSLAKNPIPYDEYAQMKEAMK